MNFDSISNMLRNLHITAITLVLLFLLCVPLAVFAYAFSALLGGLLLLTPLITLQVLTLKAMQRRLPPSATIADANAKEQIREIERKDETPLIDAN